MYTNVYITLLTRTEWSSALLADNVPQRRNTSLLSNTQSHIRCTNLMISPLSPSTIHPHRPLLAFSFRPTVPVFVVWLQEVMLTHHQSQHSCQHFDSPSASAGSSSRILFTLNTTGACDGLLGQLEQASTDSLEETAAITWRGRRHPRGKSSLNYSSFCLS